jgi:hypothetical protein
LAAAGLRKEGGILKKIGGFIVILIALQIAIAWFSAATGLRLVGLGGVLAAAAFLWLIYSLMWGGGAKATKRSMGWFTIFVVIAFAFIILNGEIPNITETLIGKVVPFGEPIAKLILGITINPPGSTHVVTYAFMQTAKLLLETILYAIISRFMYVFLFHNTADSAGSLRFFLNFGAAPIRKLAAGFVGAIISAVAATFVIEIAFTSLIGIIGDIPVLIALILLSVALVVFIVLGPLRVLMGGLGGSMLISLIVMVVMNAFVIFVVWILTRLTVV